jgi:hypothetical protein
MDGLHLKLLRKFAACLAGGLVLSVGVRGGDVMSAANPYEPIAVRNIFGLNPVTIPPVIFPEEAQLPKITPSGTMSIFDQLQVLFKVSPRPGQKDARDMFYILSEGQAQDEIVVVRIDEQAALITFKNHGILQEIPLANAPGTNSPALAGGGIRSRPGGPRSPGSQNRGAGSGPSF